MKTRKISRIFHRGLSIFLIFVYISILMSDTFDYAVYAAENNEFNYGIYSAQGLDTDEIAFASDNRGVSYDSSEDDNLAALGFPTGQLARISPSGKEIDKTKNPLGPNRVALTRFNQLAIATGGSGGSRLQLFEDPILNSGLHLLPPNESNPINNWGEFKKAITPADVNGDGKQEIVSVGLVVSVENPRSRLRTPVWELQLYMTDFNQLDPNAPRRLEIPMNSQLYKVAQNLTYNPLDLDNIYLKTVSGDFDRDEKDEIAIALDNKLYICKGDMNGLTVLSTRTFERKIGDLKTVDANGDGFKELLVTVDGEMGTIRKRRALAASLFIFNGTDLSRSVEIKLSNNSGNQFFLNATVDVGDVFGDGSKRIVIGGTDGSVFYKLSYIRYNQRTEKYDTHLEKFYNLDNYTYYSSVSGNIELKCVKLTTPVPGKPEYVVLGGFIFLYDQVTDSFEKQEVTSAQVSNFSAGDISRSKGSITNINFDRTDNTTYIYDTLVGNFDGNKEGREQIIMLHVNNWRGERHVYITSCAMNSEGDEEELHAQLVNRQRLGSNERYPYLAISAPDIHNRGVTLEFQPDKSMFVFSNPTVIAILSAPPYYEELEDKVDNMEAAFTTYGSETETSSAESNGLTVEAGVTFGYKQDASFIIKLGGVELTNEITYSFAAEWTTARTVTKNISYSNYYNDDAVVAMIIPSDIYFYKVYTYEDGVMDEDEIFMDVPYPPITTILSLDYYNSVAANIEGAPVIGPEVLNHTVGDPRSYPQSSAGLSNIEGQDVLLAADNDEGAFISSGIGEGFFTTQSIITADTFQKSFDHSFNISRTFTANVAGVFAGHTGGAGYTRNVTVSNTEKVLLLGNVAAVPREYSQHAFQWALAVYNYELDAAENNEQRCFVINYLTRPLGGSFPPAVPDNFKVNSRTLHTTTLEWEPAEDAAGYRIFRSTNINRGYEEISGIIQGRDTTTYTDDQLDLNQNYFYYIVASAATAKNSVETVPLRVESLSVNDIIIRSQPKLVYDEDDALNLTDLLVRLRIPGITNEDVPFSEFNKYNITTSIGNGVALKTGDNGIPVTVRYVPENVSVNTNNLTVRAKTPYDLLLDVNFRVGNVNNAVSLLPNRNLRANITLTNMTAQEQRVVVILALYSDKGDMVDITFLARTILANASDSMMQSLQLPRPIRGHLAKVFVLDGVDLSSTTLIPKTDSAQISAP